MWCPHPAIEHLREGEDKPGGGSTLFDVVVIPLSTGAIEVPLGDAGNYRKREAGGDTHSDTGSKADHRGDAPPDES